MMNANLLYKRHVMLFIIDNVVDMLKQASKLVQMLRKGAPEQNTPLCAMLSYLATALSCSTEEDPDKRRKMSQYNNFFFFLTKPLL